MSNRYVVLAAFVLVCVAQAQGQDASRRGDAPSTITVSPGLDLVPTILRRPATQSVIDGTHGDVVMSSPPPFTVTGVLLQAKASWPYIVAQTGSSDEGSAFVVYNAANAEMLRVRGDGNVGIGSTTPTLKLEVGNGTVTGYVHPGTVVSIGSKTNHDVTFDTNNLPRMRIDTSGNVGIGGPPVAGSAKLDVYAAPGPTNFTLSTIRAIDAGGRAGFSARAGDGTTSSRYAITQYLSSEILPQDWWTGMVAEKSFVIRNQTAGRDDITIDTLGNVGIGGPPLAGSAKLDVYAAPGPTNFTLSTIRAIDAGGRAASSVRAGDGVASSRYAFTQYYSSESLLQDWWTGMVATKNYVIRNNTVGRDDVTVDTSGNVGIGTATPVAKLDVQGNINVSGNINAKYQDVAEWVQSDDELAAGTVVILSTTAANHVKASTESYDTTVAGVISATPGISLGEPGHGKALVATTGRVRVRVDATPAPIKIGDLLVTSDTPGAAMKSVPIEMAGRRLHQPGTVLGKALEPLSSGTGEILVLLTLQ